MLEALAERISLPAPDPQPNAVALVGYLLDRHEGDHWGNLAELQRLLGGLGLETVSIWLSGQPYQRLADVSRASAIVALPHGRLAAHRLGERLGLPVIDADLPLGLAGTARWLRTIGAALDREQQAMAVCQAGFSRCAPRVESALSRVFLGRRLAFVGDPHYAGPLAEMIAEFGAEIRVMFLSGRAEHLSAEEAARLAQTCSVSFEPREPAMIAEWSQVEEQINPVLSTGPGLELLRPSCAFVEWGFPSHRWHCFADAPFLGFEGCLHLVTRLAEATGRASVR